ncbi:lipopolysaccharide biosynthesis protein, partial [Actinocrinis sp.]|uniref:lipopolysaccharide biosynthesis protein n=1 Tax=Actinocrinis sp. TaxID=1920516 RepID=UPI002D4036DE
MGKHAESSMKIVQNSFFMMASMVMTAGLGFLFWGLVARLYSTERVGLATSLISAISLISYLGLLGFNNTVVRFPAAGAARNSQVTVALGITGTACCLFGGIYLAALPWISPKLLFVRQDAWFAVTFVLFCGFAGVNLLTDSVFVAARIPQYNLLVDGVIQSLTKLAMPIFLVTLGAAGIVTATGIGYAVAVVASLAAMRWRLKFRPDFRTRGTRLREQARFSLASYLSALLNLVPLLALPSIALQDLGPSGAADYF